MESKTPIRLQKFLAHLGYGSRRTLEGMITAGNISVNGKKAYLGMRVTGNEDIVINGKQIKVQPIKTVVYMVNKPTGIVSTVRDEYSRKTVCDLIPVSTRLFPVGRLDKDTSGLILVTNDGELAQKLTHPKYEVEKEYTIVLAHPLTTQQIDQILEGVEDEREIFHIDKIEKIGKNSYSLILHEGKKREIRRIMKYFDVQLLSLKRIRIGSLKIGDLQEGNYKQLTPNEIYQLMPRD